MKPYPKYRDSGVELIGDVPEHWEVKKIKYHTYFQKGKNPKELRDSPGKNSMIYLAMDYLRESPKQIYYVESHEDFIKVDDREILLLWDGSNAGEFVISKKGVLSSTMAVLRVRDIQKIFCWYSFKNFEIYLKESTVGMGIPHVNSDELKNGFLTVPSITEQTAIAAFLDRKTAEIDSIISKKERLIELYEEEKAAVINHAVTKGLDPAAKMKDSGIEWLGEIPEHWDIVPLRRTILSIDQGWSPIADSSPAIENQHGVLKLSCIREGKFISSENKALDELSIDIKNLSPTNGDVLISRANTPDRVGDTCFIDENYPLLIIPDLIYRLKVNRESLHPKYLVSFLLSRSGRTQIQLDARGTSGSMVKVGQNHLRNWLIPLPLLDEQAAIVQYVETKCSRIDAIISKLKRQIELLKEYRTALISEAVTGKIDVRNPI